MRCAHCGLPTEGEASHGTVEECVQALLAETSRLRHELEAVQRAHEENPPSRPDHPDRQKRRRD